MSYTKRVIIGLAAAALLTSPFIASADTLSDLQAKIQALLSQLSALQSQVQQLQVTPSQTPVQIQAAAPAVAIRCPVITRTLAYGANGSDVSQLQTFLSQQGVYSDEVTGFFGAKTQAALQTWQAQQGLASSGTPATTGWGVLGPRSQSTLARLCPPPQPQSGSFSATPSAGKAPLDVKFKVTVPTGGTGDTYMIDFGDGSHAVVQSAVACAAGTSFVAGNCPDIRGTSHTYMTDGVYTASLYRQASNAGACAGNTVCGTLVTSTKITVSSTIACKIIDCAPGYHLEGASCSAEQRCVPNNASAPVINGVSGPSSLQVGEIGTWTVQASIASGADTNLTYSVIWGDESILGQLNALAGASSVTSATGSFTHSYATAGTYTPTFAVSNTNGIAQASASVKVGVTGVPFPVCPVYAMQVCPAGYTYGPGTTNGNGCYQPGPCIPKTNGCIDDGNTYPEGTKRQCIKSSTGLSACVADASYVCRNGEWKIEGGLPVPSPAFSVSPASGSAPLSVTFKVNGAGEHLIVSFGDGTSAASWNMYVEGGYSTIVHTYEKAGTYTAKLHNNNGIAAAMCYGVDCNVIGTATVTVTGGTSSGAVTATANGLKVTISAPAVAQKMQECTYSVGWFGSSGNGLTVDWGDGTVSPKNTSFLQGTSCTSEVTSHTYPSSGTYTIKVRSWHPGPTDAPVTDWEGSTSVIVSGVGGPIVCPAYQMPICPAGQRVATVANENGCSAPICVGYADTIYSQSTTAEDSQLASALTALQGALAKIKSLFGN